ncbi:hypothetical protein AVEN_221504-1 [Araneus ventricosus]|uniref:Uncharacterized protein n=1 Tax=Araneus ventricosus TaxID=182803 RepID=A0A4Y2E329_ARAVE|nr:hypothetical protein AVEN_221504-1 [Araneus ventricosus]
MFTPTYTTGGSHLNVLLGGVYYRWLTPVYPIGRRVPPVAHTWMSDREACPTGGSHLDVRSEGVSHRWLTFGCPIGRRVPPVAYTWISHWTLPH